MTYDGDEVVNLGKADGKCFMLIRKLWENAGDPQELHLIRKNYTVTKISDGLLLDNVFAVKGVTSVLLYLSLVYPKDFMTDKFFDNYLTALQNPTNKPNLVILARLIRLLQVNKDFGDWMISKGVSPEDNKIWDCLYELTKEHSEEDIKKEAARAVKEGTRQGATEGQYCIIPEKNLERLKKDVVWKLTDDDMGKLSELGKYDVSDDEQSPEERLNAMEHANTLLKAEYIERINLLEAKILDEQQEKEKNLEDIARAQARLRELLNTASDSLSADMLPQTVNVSEIEEVQIDANTLAKQVHQLCYQHNNVQESIRRLTLEVQTLRMSNVDKNKDIDNLKKDLHTFITKSLEKVEGSLLPLIQGGPAAVSSSSLQDPSDPTPPPVEEIPLPEGWEKKLDTNTNRFYYINRATKKTQWKPPQQ